MVKGLGRRVKGKKVSKSAYKEILSQLEREPDWPPCNGSAIDNLAQGATPM